MALPAELRLLCHQLSSTPNDQLPRIIPILVRNVLRCQGPLRSGGNPTAVPDSSEISVLVHKLKTQVSTLLHSKDAEGRFTAVVLIKAIVTVGGWEVLRGVESWVRGLLSVLGKKDPVPTKRLCILSLTSIYLLTYEYQSLVREITMPTLPSFVSSCLSLISPKSSIRAPEVPFSLVESILDSFCVLISLHPTIFRPYGNQIQAIIRPYLAPTLSDRHLVPSSLSCNARRVAVLLYQTSPKSTSGEEWGKGIRSLVKGIHGTIDQVYRAVIEDWEPTAGYVSQTVNHNKEVQGAKSEDDLPAWNGIEAGIQRLEGLLWLLREHFMHRTATAVSVPTDLIIDLLTRLTSVVRPIDAKSGIDNEEVRLHPAIERNERDGLWAGLSKVHSISMELYLVLIDRFQHNFASLAQRCLSQVAWIFSSYSHDERFRCISYQLMAKILLLCGPSLEKSAVALLTPMIKTCCKEFPILEDKERSRPNEASRNHPTTGSSANVDTFLNLDTISKNDAIASNGSEVLKAATEFLPLFLSHLPQQHLEGYLRATIDQTAILSHSKEAMLSSVLNPYLGKNGRMLPSILPHLCRDFANHPAVEALLRPRLPILRQNQAISFDHLTIEDSLQEPKDLMEDVIAHGVPEDTGVEPIDIKNAHVESEHVSEYSGQLPKVHARASHDLWGGTPDSSAKIESIVPKEKFSLLLPTPKEPDHPELDLAVPIREEEEEEEEEDSDESVHLNMDLSDSEDESVF